MSMGTRSVAMSIPAAAKASRNIFFCMFGAQPHDHLPFAFEHVGQEAVAVLFAQLWVDEAVFDRQFHAKPG